MERKGCEKIGEVGDKEILVCGKTSWKPVEYEKYERHDVWSYMDNNGYEIEIDVALIPKGMKEANLWINEENYNYLVRLSEPYSTIGFLDFFKTKPEALIFVKEWMEKHPEGLGKQYGEWMLDEELDKDNEVTDENEDEIQIERKEGQVFGIYKLEGEFAVSDGSNLYYLFSGISFIDEDVVIGIPRGAKLTDYNLRVTPNRWKIYDTATNKIIKEGKAIGDFFDTIGNFKDKLLGI